jgi:dTDP-4-dehydrorhamnose 3,5-epimerase
MPFIKTEFDGLVVFEPVVFRDDRGYFFESFNERVFNEAGLHVHFVQDNQAFSGKNTLRGLHYQVEPFAQAKLVRVLFGKVLDVVVDLRKQSGTYGKWYAHILSDENQQQLFVPKGFAHGYLVLSKTAVFSYKCDNFYSKTHEGGIRPDCPILNIDWGIDLKKALIAERDRSFPSLGDHRIG